MYKIMIVEDDEVISEQVARCLERWSYEVYRVRDFSNIIAEFAAEQPHLVLMDISLPFFNGYHWCAEIRRISKLPIMFMSSASDNLNIVMAMNMGGDDFIAKPFDTEVLSAKIQAMLRRAYSFQPQLSVLEHNGVVLNLSDASILIGGERVELTKNEYKILCILFENKGKAVSRDEIMNALWSSSCFIDDNTLTVNVNRLRKKLEQAGKPDFIATKKGIGYMLEME